MLITPVLIREYLDRVAQSGVLGRGARRPALLEYLVNAEANGHGDMIKAYPLGIDVFDKPKDFDPTTDSTVRVEMGRLRKALDLFEASDMADTTIKVDIPVGTYRPVITLRYPDAPLPETSDGQMHTLPVLARQSGSRLTRVVLGLAVLGALVAAFFYSPRGQIAQAPEGPPITLTVEDFGGDKLGRELAILVKDSFLNNPVVTIPTEDPKKIAEGQFAMRGNITDLNDYTWVSVELTNAASNQVVWNHVFELDEEKDLKTEIDTKLNGELKTRLIGAAKTLLETRDIEDLTPEQLFILATWVSGPAISSYDWETERVTLMKLALERNPDYGPAHSVLADKYGFLANVHPLWDTEENLRLSRYHAERAADLSPLDANVLFNVAQSYWHTGRHKASQRVFRRVTELDGGNSLARFFAKVVPYWCADVPDDVMDWAIDFDHSLSQDDPIRWIVLTWIGTMHTNRGEYNLALQAATEAAQIFQVGYTYMLHAMLLNKVGQPGAAQSVFDFQLTPWPGISTSHYANSTIPRLCLEQPNPERFINDYKELEAALAKNGKDPNLAH